jgi:hypothetical protein
VKPSTRIKELREKVIQDLIQHQVLPEIDKQVDVEQSVFHRALVTREEMLEYKTKKIKEAPEVWLQAILDYLDEQMLTPQPWVDEPGTDVPESCDKPDIVPR